MTTVNITVENDADFYAVFQYQTVVIGTPIDITGTTMVMKLRRHAKDEAALLQLTTEAGDIALVDPVSGKFTVRIAQSVLVQLATGDYDHSIVMTWPGGHKRSLWTGKFTNNPGASR
jgi:hypothetical protein